mmetsp:Transcript_47639/g.120091  ORF Transcript_47639/g.120091 Transcript_47639/m.120091 type:complete len:202 (+) Transcript_47639:1209-1814(+)
MDLVPGLRGQSVRRSAALWPPEAWNDMRFTTWECSRCSSGICSHRWCGRCRWTSCLLATLSGRGWSRRRGGDALPITTRRRRRATAVRGAQCVTDQPPGVWAARWRGSARRGTTEGRKVWARRRCLKARAVPLGILDRLADDLLRFREAQPFPEELIQLALDKVGCCHGEECASDTVARRSHAAISGALQARARSMAGQGT